MSRTLTLVTAIGIVGTALAAGPGDRGSDRSDTHSSPVRQQSAPAQNRSGWGGQVQQNNRSQPTRSAPVQRSNTGWGGQVQQNRRQQPVQSAPAEPRTPVQQSPNNSGWGSRAQQLPPVQTTRSQGPDRRASVRPQAPTDYNFHGDRQGQETAYRQKRQGSEVKVKDGHVRQDPRWGNHWRYGYDGREGGGISFNFGFYLFSPFDANCYVSPWYDYDALPPYIAASQVDVIGGHECNWNAGSPYAIQSLNYPLSQAVGEIQDSFLNQDAGQIDALIPAGTQVGIFTDASYDYSLSGGEFQQMVSDNLSQVDTLNFSVSQVRQFNGGAIVKAAQTVQDPDGSTGTVYQTYRLMSEGGQYVITDFMTSLNG